MSIYIKNSEGVTPIQDLNSKVSILEYYEAKSGDAIASAESNVTIKYVYFKKCGKVV